MHQNHLERLIKPSFLGSSQVSDLVREEQSLKGELYLENHWPWPLICWMEIRPQELDIMFVSDEASIMTHWELWCCGAHRRSGVLDMAIGFASGLPALRQRLQALLKPCGPLGSMFVYLELGSTDGVDKSRQLPSLTAVIFVQSIHCQATPFPSSCCSSSWGRRTHIYGNTQSFDVLIGLLTCL